VKTHFLQLVRVEFGEYDENGEWPLLSFFSTVGIVRVLAIFFPFARVVEYSNL